MPEPKREPTNDMDRAAINQYPEVMELTDPQITRELNAAQTTIDEETSFVEALCAEQRRRNGPSVVSGFAYKDTAGVLYPNTVAQTEQASRVNALLIVGKAVVTAAATEAEIMDAAAHLLPGTLVPVRITEVLPATTMKGEVN